MVWYTPENTAVNGTAQTLLNADGIFIARPVLFMSYNSYAIFSTGHSNEVDISGSVATGGSGTVAIQLGDSFSGDYGHSVTIRETGEVLAADFGTCMNIEGYNSVVNNAGLLVSKGGVGLYMRGTSTSTTSTVINSGRIEAGLGIGRNNSDADAETLVLINTGVIKAEVAYGVFFLTNTVGRDLITNTGLMEGTVNLYGSNDTYNGRKGTVTGSVDGGSGNDILIGGIENNILLGGTGADKLTGGRGQDEMTGGTGADIFIFEKITDSRRNMAAADTIVDFVHAEGDHISLKAIDANGAESGNGRFDFIGKSAFSHEAGELRYARSGSDTVISGDVNGDGKADFVIVVDGLMKLVASDFIL